MKYGNIIVFAVILGLVFGGVYIFAGGDAEDNGNVKIKQKGKVNQ